MAGLELVCHLLVIAGVLTLLLITPVELGRWLESPQLQANPPEGGQPPTGQVDSSHQLAVFITQALVRHKLLEENRFNEAAQLISLKLELREAIEENEAGSHALATKA
jgi:hypothetical protein